MYTRMDALRPATISHHFESLNPAIVVNTIAAKGRPKNVSLPRIVRVKGIASKMLGASIPIPKTAKQKSPIHPNKLR
jgi:hypothetical protein